MKKLKLAPGEITPGKHRNLREPWKPGESGNPAGRPRGSRHKLSEVFLGEVCTAWQEQGRAAIDAMIAKNPADFVRVVASLVPRQFDLSPQDPYGDIGDDELEEILTVLRSAIAERKAALDDSAAGDGQPLVDKKPNKIN